jgi:hypothetical protein
VYDALCLDLAIDYAQPPDQPLAGDDQVWARSVLEAGR